MFLRDERGNFSIEFLLWTPVFVALIAIIVDASLLFQLHADMWSVARDGARMLALGTLDEAGTEAYMLAQLAQMSSEQFDAAAALAGTGPDRTAEVSISSNIGSASVFGAFAEMLADDLSARVVMHAVER